MHYLIGFAVARCFSRIEASSFVRVTVMCTKNNPSNCWDTLKAVIPQHKNEIRFNVMVTKVEKNHSIAHG